MRNPKTPSFFVFILILIFAMVSGCKLQGSKKEISYPNPPEDGEWDATFSDFFADNKGWFVGSCGPSLGNCQNHLYLTDDGGVTWTEIGNVNHLWPRVLTAATFFDSRTVYLCFRYDIENLGPIYRSVNGGESWDRLDIPEFFALAQGGVGEVRKIEFDESGNGEIDFYYRPPWDEEGSIQSFVSYDKGETWALSDVEGLFSKSTGDIEDYLPRLLKGEAVGDYEILPCLEKFTQKTWAYLNSHYEGEFWFNALWEKLDHAAVNKDIFNRDIQKLRDYYIGKAYLSSDGAYSEGLADIVLKQWDYDGSIYSECLGELFSANEASSLKNCITYANMYWRDDPFCLHSPNFEGGIGLFSYPDDFPFGYDLKEKSRNTLHAETFGKVVEIECDTLQVTYLDNGEGVYKVIKLRTKEKGYESLGIYVGDDEGTLFSDGGIRKLQGLGYDDDLWFGEDYTCAYAYTPKNSTKSVLFVVKDSRVFGIQLIDGLDGPLY